MKQRLPKLSKFSKGKKVVIGDRQSFSILGVITDVVPKDEFPIKVDANLGQFFELSLAHYGETWSLDE